MKDKLKKFGKWVSKTIKNILVFKGWPVVLFLIGHSFVVNKFPVENLDAYIVAFVVLSWTEIRDQIIEWWKKD